MLVRVREENTIVERIHVWNKNIQYMCHLSDDVMLQVDKALKISLGLDDKKEGDDSMNDLQVFNNEDLHLQVRTILNDDGSISVNAEDTAIGFGWIQTQNKNGRQYTSVRWERMNGFSAECGFPHEWGKDDYIPESLFYRLGMKANNQAAEKFQNWLAMDVIPSIRKTGGYKLPNMTKEMRAILLLDSRTDQMEKRIDKLEFDSDLSGCEADELSSHVKRKGVNVLGGKISEAYRDKEIRQKVYRDIYDQIKREFGIYDDAGKPRTYKALKKKYLADAHDLIDCYEAPMYLQELINTAKSQISFGRNP